MKTLSAHHKVRLVRGLHFSCEMYKINKWTYAIRSAEFIFLDSGNLYCYLMLMSKNAIGLSAPITQRSLREYCNV